MEEKPKASEFVERVKRLAAPVALAVAFVLSLLGFFEYDLNEFGNAATARGVTNFDSLTLSDDLVVGGDVSVTGDSSFTGDFGNLVTIGDATAADAVLLYDGNAQDYYLALDDSADDFIIGLGSTVGTTGIVYLDENQDVGLGGASAGAKLDITGNQMVDGAADEIQVLVQGYTTQTSSLQVWEQSDGTDVGTMSNAGALDIESTFNAAGLATFQAGLTSSDGDNVVADDLRVTAQTSITVTNGSPFAATGTYQPIVAASQVTPTLTAGTAGDLLVLINTGTNVINIADTGTQMLTAAAALGQYDSLTLWSDGTNWIEISRADN